MRHYLYISDAKVDAAFGQLPSTRKAEIAASIGVSLGVLTARFGSRRASMSDRVERLELVEREIRSRHTVRGLGSSANWIDATLAMTPVRAPAGEDVMLFVHHDDVHVFALGGSSYHLIGELRAASSTSTYTHAPRLVDALHRIVASVRPGAIGNRRELRRQLHLRVSDNGKVAPWTRLLDEVAALDDGYPPLHLRFLARVLHDERWALAGRRYTLATPLYVALAD